MRAIRRRYTATLARETALNRFRHARKPVVSFRCADISNERISFFISKFRMGDKNFAESGIGEGGRKEVEGNESTGSGSSKVKQKGMVSS